MDPKMTHPDAPTLNQVEAGAKFLDDTIPDWFERINLDLLDMGDDEYCILGQLFEDYVVACDNLHIACWYSEERRQRDRFWNSHLPDEYFEHHAYELGFTINPKLVDKTTFEQRTVHFDALKSMWGGVIHLRLANKEAS